MTAIDFRNVFDAISSPYMMLDREYRYVAANPAYQRAVMRSLDELLGRNLFDLFPDEGESGRRLRESFERVFATGEADTLAYIPYDIPRPDGGSDQRYWTAVHTPLKGSDRRVDYLIQNTVDVTELQRLKEAASLPFRVLPGETDLLQRAREAEQAKREIQDQSADFRRLFQQAPGFMAVLTGPDHVFTFANDAYVRLIGGRHVLGMPAKEALPEISGQGFFEMLDAVYASGRPQGGEGVRVLLQHSQDELPQEAFVDFLYQPIFGATGTIVGVFVQGVDRTERFRDQERQKLLLAELNHRVKNTLATVQSIAAQTLRNADSPATARVALEARLLALSKTHNLLSAGHWSGADLRAILAQELEHYGPERVRLDGPDVELPPRAGLALGLIVHELATNAAKYGALSAAGGRVRVEWSVEPGTDRPDCLVLEWRESGGPAVTEPSRQGFGSRLIARSLEAELNGNASLRFEPTGVVFSARIPLAQDGE